MKLMHTDQEMSRRVDLKRSPPPNLVAKLMGLDSLRNEEHDSVVRSDHTRSRSEIPLSYWEEQDDRSFHCVGLDRCRNAYNMSKQPLKFGYNESPTTDDERMVYVRRKFLEARSRSTDEKIRHSKLFQDALQVSTSVIPHPRITERITFLDTSKMSNSVGFARSGNNENGKYDLVDQDYVKYTQPAPIVVLKPKPYTVSSLYSSQLDSPRMIGEGFIGDVEDVENRELRESVKAITIQMRRRLNRYQKDETLKSSVFKKSETECNPRESEADMSPLSGRHSWDCLSRSGITYSQSGVSRASYDAESSVSREAKKRLSERWVLMSSNASSQESRRNCSTLGEMLSLSEVKKKLTKAEGKCIVNKNSNPTLVRPDEDATSSLRNHKRSKSLRASTLTKPNTDHLVLGSKHRACREDTETKSVRLSLKEKVASFFFSKNKKTSKVKSLHAATKNELQRASADFHRDRNRIIYNKVPCHPSPGLQELSCVGSLATVIGKQDMECLEVVLTPKRPSTSVNSGENQDQPSPISVLDTHFEEDELLTANCEQFDRDTFQFQHDPICSKLLDKSPPIGSVARTLSWDHSYADAASSYPCKEPLTIQESEGDEILLENVSSSTLLDEATSKINAWLCGEIRCFSDNLPDDNTLVVGTKEVLDKGWTDKLSLETGNLGKEIERKLLDELVREALFELTGREEWSVVNHIHSNINI